MNGELYDRALAAVETLLGELEALEDCDVTVSLPDDVNKAAQEHGWLVDVMRNAPEEWKEKLRDLYNVARLKPELEYVKRDWTVKGPQALEAVKEEAERLLEEARRETLLVRQELSRRDWL